MDTKKPEALRLAGVLRALDARSRFANAQLTSASEELETLHAENESLRTGYDAARLEIASLHTQMEAGGAGGMEPLRKRCLHQISDPANAGWCDGCSPDNCGGCVTPASPAQAGEYPELPDLYSTGEPGREGYILPISFARAILAKWGTPAQASRAPVAAPAGMQPVARIRYERNTPGRENEMPRVVSCNRMADGVYEVFTADQVQDALAAAPSGPVREPLRQERLQFLSGEYEDIPEEGVAFRDGWRSAEMHHGITAAQKGCQDAEV